MAGYDYLIEKKLYALDPGLHKRVTESLIVLEKILSDYQMYFPEYTDHTEVHSIAVIDYCNNLIGEKNIDNLNADELYVLLMSCYLHDVGMGISGKDYDLFSTWIDFGDYFETHDREDIPRVIRTFHNEFSACFIHKYAQLFDFPSDEHLFSAIQVARGHRKTDLFDETSYPSQVKLRNDKNICLPYLAALIRLADEIDVAQDRNTKLLFDPNSATTEKQRMENAKHEAIKKMTIYTDRIELDVKTSDAHIKKEVIDLLNKVQKTLDYCVRVVDERTPFEITQKKLLVNMIEGDV